MSILKAEKALYQIKDILLENEKIRRLLYITVPSALDYQDIPSIDDVEKLITLTPIIEDEHGIAESYKNVFIAIYLSQITFGMNSSIYKFKIAIYSNKQNYQLNNEKIRVLSIMQEVIRVLDYKKLEFAGKIFIIDAAAENIEKGNFSGFVTTWEVADGEEAI